MSVRFTIARMPRVSEAHRAARRRQILDAARVCFTRNGFHATSMQDVIGEAGLSVGAVYRYFKSKDELVIAIADEIVGSITARLVEIRQTQPRLPLVDALRQVMRTVEPELGPDGAFRFAIQAWAESLRNPTLAGMVERIYKQMRDNFVDLARAARDAGELPADTDPRAAGSALFSLLPGYGLQRVLLGEPDPETYLAGMCSLLGATIAR
jgi:AcrR family transcriptional regulator